MRRTAANWLELAERVWHYRRDVITASESAELARLREGLKQLLKANADAARLKLGIESLEASLRKCGGAIYPKTAVTENVEFFLVAAIVILGIRTYFVQPFKIPTNSMWPTYYGMTAENLPPGSAAPGPLERVFRFAAFGAERKEAVAPHDGRVSLAFFNRYQVAYTLYKTRTWLIIPTKVKQYTFYVDGDSVAVRVPQDFGDSEFRSLVISTFFGSAAAFDAYWEGMQRSGELAQDKVIRFDEGSEDFRRVVELPLPGNARAGQPILRFDRLTGDQLFVDRVSYNFVRPKVGQGFVFRTGNIPGIGLDEYYIKRLVGQPGDLLEVRSPVLYRNGVPISGAEAFRLNAERVAPYGGYTYGNTLYDARFLFKGETLTVPPGGFFAMGDNSANSSDGRVWGFVPEKDVVGRPLCIYYPFTRRWGPAR